MMSQVQNHQVRSQVLDLFASIGALCNACLNHLPLDQPYKESRSDDVSFDSVPENIDAAMKKVLFNLLEISTSLSVDLKHAILAKVDLNRRKYPVGVCKGKSEKYTAYSHLTGITANKGQFIFTGPDGTNSTFPSDFLQSVQEMTDLVCQCSKEREWNRLNRPRSLVLAVVGEAGELAELFQFRPDWETSTDKQIVDKAAQEIADIAIYLLQLARRCNVVLAE